MLNLSSINDAYASVMVATYEPLILQWLSGLGLAMLRRQLTVRGMPVRQNLAPYGGERAATLSRFHWRGAAVGAASDPRVTTPVPIGRHAGPTPGGERAERRVTLGGLSLPGSTSIARSALPPLQDAQELSRRIAEIDRIFSDPGLTIAILTTGLKTAQVPALFGPRLEHVLSPIGVMHIYRELFFDAGAALGPVEQVFAIAPGERLEILQEITRRQVYERTEEFGEETTRENMAESQNVEEIADKVSSSIMRDMEVGVSASAEGTIGVWSAGASADVNLALSTEQSREATRSRVLSHTKRSTETIRKSYSLTLRNVEDITNVSATRRQIRNDSAEPVNYALRRVMRKVVIKLQALGPHMVWQLYVANPGAGLAQPRMVMFHEADQIAPPDLPPNAPPKPQGGSDSGSQTVDITDIVSLPPVPPSMFSVAKQGKITVSVLADPARSVTGMVIDSIVDAAPEGKDPSAPGILPDAPVRTEAPDGSAVTFKFTVEPGSAKRVIVQYTIHFEPSAVVMQEWQTQVQTARAAFQAVEMEKQFERAKQMITAKSRVRPRPRADLRDEERAEVLNRMISEAFRSSPAEGFPSPVEIELFHRYFDVSAIFYYLHPSWWRPRYSQTRSTYEITEESEPAAYGKSLGWLIQLDGDRRRNEFLNSPWVRVCVPMKPGQERAACEWLAEHIEGQRGFSLQVGTPGGDLLQGIETRRGVEAAAAPGPDYVTLDGEVAPSRAAAADAYPVVDQFEVMLPTDGFVYETVKMPGE